VEDQPLADEEQQLLSLGDSILRVSVRQPTAGTGTSSPVAGIGGHRAFLDRVGDATGATMTARLEAAGSPYTLRAGTLVPGMLLTEINSELPGEIVGQVSRNVYDSRTQRTLLVPKGSRLIGSYDNQVAAGEGRLLVAWTRLILPDGRSMTLPGLALKDRRGATGAKGEVDNHWRRVFGNALLLSALGAGVQLSQPQPASVLTAPSARQVAAGALGQELSHVALEILRRGMDVAPTITIPAGQPFNVFLNGDVVFDRPYVEEPHGAR
jgi:type IV secretion system protein VirB10